MNNNGNTVARKVFLWILFAILAFLMLIYIPSMTANLFLLAAIIIIPIPKLEEFWEKKKFNIWIRLGVVFVIFCLAIKVAPTSRNTTVQENTNTSAEVSQSEEEKNREIVVNTGYWCYGDDIAVNCHYHFMEDGTFTMWGEGGAQVEGLFQIEGNTLTAMSTESKNVFTIIDSKTLQDDQGYKLHKDSEPEG